MIYMCRTAESDGTKSQMITLAYVIKSYIYIYIYLNLEIFVETDLVKHFHCPYGNVRHIDHLIKCFTQYQLSTPI